MSQIKVSEVVGLIKDSNKIVIDDDNDKINIIINNNEKITIDNTGLHGDIILSDTGVDLGTYGSATSIPILSISEDGRVLNASSVEINVETGIPGVIGDAMAVSFSNVRLTNPPATVDGYSLSYDDVILLIGQQIKSENGFWVYKGPGETLVRPDFYFTNYVFEGIGGTTNISTKGNIIEGVSYAGYTFEIKSPTGGLVDTTATTWGEYVGIGNKKFPGQKLAGARRASNAPIVPEFRRDDTTDASKIFSAYKYMQVRKEPYWKLGRIRIFEEWFQDTSNALRDGATLDLALRDVDTLIFTSSSLRLNTVLTLDNISNKTLIALPLKGSSVSFRTVLPTSNGLQLRNCSNIKFVGNFDFTAPAGTNNSQSGLMIGRGCSNIELENVSGKGFDYLVNISADATAPTKDIRIKKISSLDAKTNALRVKGFSATYTVENVLIEYFQSLFTTSGGSQVSASIEGYTKNIIVGSQGGRILYGGKGLVTTATSVAARPQNCGFGRIYIYGTTTYGVDLIYGSRLFCRAIVDTSTIYGYRLNSTLSGIIDLDYSQAINSGQHGYYDDSGRCVGKHAYNIVAKGNGTSSTNTYSGYYITNSTLKPDSISGTLGDDNDLTAASASLTFSNNSIAAGTGVNVLGSDMLCVESPTVPTSLQFLKGSTREETAANLTLALQKSTDTNHLKCLYSNTTAHIVVATYKIGGTVGNSESVTETINGAVWNNATLTGGSGTPTQKYGIRRIGSGEDSKFARANINGNATSGLGE